MILIVHSQRPTHPLLPESILGSVRRVRSRIDGSASRVRVQAKRDTAFEDRRTPIA
jgi:hypothetical protein